jgi:XisI protein
MDQVDYPTLLETLFLSYQDDARLNGLIESQVVIDKERGHYQVLSVGWKPDGRVHDVLLHVDLKDHKFWVQQDFTLPSITSLLLEAGVPKSDIVLGFQPPDARKLMDFAVS